MPIVASLGGNTSNQTVALLIRGLALDQIHRGNLGYLVYKETGIRMGLSGARSWSWVDCDYRFDGVLYLSWAGSGLSDLIHALPSVIHPAVALKRLIARFFLRKIV